MVGEGANDDVFAILACEPRLSTYVTPVIRAVLACFPFCMFSFRLKIALGPAALGCFGSIYLLPRVTNNNHALLNST